MKAPVVVTLFLVLLVPSFPALSPGQEKSAPAAETSARVPALEDFHTVIYKLWHNAWPQKDIDQMVRLRPEIEAGAAKVASAELPGILRDKQEAWGNGVTSLQECATRYGTAAGARDSVALLHEGELLHMQYEKLMRLIRPPMKEIDAFHGELYMLYHHYGPAFDLATIRSSAGALKEKMDTLNAAQLPERHKAKEERFTAARTDLSSSVNALQTTVGGGNREAIEKAIDSVHSKYQALEKVFE
jgi:hypothetical protein